jgi:hypothetical protein
MAFTFRPKAFIAAVNDAWPAWLVLAGFVAATVVGFAVSCDLSHQILYAGTILEILGLALVAVGLEKLRRSFGKPSPFKMLRAWLEQMARAFRPPQVVEGTATMSGSGTLEGHLSTVLIAAPLSTIDRRVEILEQNLELLRNEVGTKHTELQQMLTEVKAQLGREVQTRDDQLRRLSSQTENLAVGGLGLEVVGWIWLLAGCIGANIPDEIARMFAMCSALPVLSALFPLSTC